MGGSVLSGVGSGVNVTSRSIAHCVDGFLEGILLDSSLGSSVDMLGASVAFTVGIGITMWYHQPLSIGGQALAHMQYAEVERAHSQLPVDLNMVNAKLR